ncbi:putative exonuclease, partial [Escherichia coli 96.0107]
YCWRSH